jgi:hypothetical protein
MKTGDLYFSYYGFVRIPWSDESGMGGPILSQPLAVLILHAQGGTIECMADGETHLVSHYSFTKFCTETYWPDDPPDDKRQKFQAFH